MSVGAVLFFVDGKLALGPVDNNLHFLSFLLTQTRQIFEMLTPPEGTTLLGDRLGKSLGPLEPYRAQ